jgi:hypothetical protein
MRSLTNIIRIIKSPKTQSLGPVVTRLAGKVQVRFSTSKPVTFTVVFFSPYVIRRITYEDEEASLIQVGNIQK